MIDFQRGIQSNEGGRGENLGEIVETQQFVSFTVAGQDYGLDIMFVREIKAWAGTTRLPNSPDYMRGVINLRGSIVPVLDMGFLFNKRETAAIQTTVVLIVYVAGTHIGLLVDAVSDIVTANKGEISRIPDVDAENRNAYFSGLFATGEKLMAIVSIEDLLNSVNASRPGRAAPIAGFAIDTSSETLSIRL